MICQHCGGAFRAKRADARTCSPRCRKAISRREIATVGGDVTLSPAVVPEICDAAPEPTFLLPGDTVSRRWREIDGMLEVEALVPGGWLEVRASKAWLVGL